MKSNLSRRFGTFTVIPNAFFQDSAISNTEFRLFAYFCYRTNQETETAFPSYDTIKRDTGMSYQTIANAVRQLEAKGWLTRKKRFSGTTIYAIDIPLKNRGLEAAPVLQNLEDSPLVNRVQSSKKQSLTRRGEQDEKEQDEIPPQSSIDDVANAGKPATSTNAQVEIQTLENSESEKGARVPPPAPARATTADTRRADDMIQVYAERKAGGKLQHWDITRNAIDAAIANRHHEDKAAINRACDEVGEIVATAANANGWHTYRSKKDLMQIVALDLPIDLIRTFIDADCTAIKSKQANRENYGTGDALQSVRIGMANMQKANAAQSPTRRYEYQEVDGELKIVWMD